MVLDGTFLGVSKTSYGESYFVGLPKKRSEQLYKLSKKKEDRDEDDSSSLFNKQTNLHPPTYNRAADPQAFEE